MLFCVNQERDSLVCERSLQIGSKIDLIGSYFYGEGMSAESQLSAKIPQTPCATCHQHHRIEIYLLKYAFLKIYHEKKYVILVL